MRWTDKYCKNNQISMEFRKLRWFWKSSVECISLICAVSIILFQLSNFFVVYWKLKNNSKKMADNPAPNNAAANKKKKPNNQFFRMRNRFHNDSGPRQRPVSLLIPQSSSSSLTSNNTADSANETASNGNSSVPPTRAASFRINKRCGPYSGWQLYFPEIGNYSPWNYFWFI